MKDWFFLRIVRRLRHVIPPTLFAKLGGMKIGAGTIISTKNIGSEPYLISIGERCHITAGVSFVTHDGGVWVFRKDFPSIDMFGKIVIGNNTYIGNNALILPGVNIGSNCVIGASSVVTKSVPDDSVVAGNPAKYICSTQEYLKKSEDHFLPLKGVIPKERRNEILKSEELFLKKPSLK